MPAWLSCWATPLSVWSSRSSVDFGDELGRACVGLAGAGRPTVTLEGGGLAAFEAAPGR